MEDVKKMTPEEELEKKILEKSVEMVNEPGKKGRPTQKQRKELTKLSRQYIKEQKKKIRGSKR